MKSSKPLKRSRLRIMLGKAFYTVKRFLHWHFGHDIYAKQDRSITLNHVCFTHYTPLIRHLKNVEMWMQYNKVENLKIAVRKLDGVILRPGQTFSYWKLIGMPTRRKGYKEGMVLYYGGFKPGVGGGLCQLSNLIYWMTLHTPLKVTERYRHSFDVFPDYGRTQPFGSGATCVYNYRDLQIYNDTDESYQLHLYLDNQNLYGEWRASEKPEKAYQIYEKRHWISQEFWGGYIRHNTIYRRIFDNCGNELKDEYVSENHAIMMYSPLLNE